VFVTEYLKLKKANCKNCYKCIRHCPVKSISFSSDQANIVQDECILCGQCFVTCPQNAKIIRGDVDRARELLAGNAPVVASIAPAFVANYAGVTIGSMRAALRCLGFSDAQETALGATIVKRHYDDMVRKGQQQVIISSCCHSVNLLIQKYYPGALPYIARVVSPMQAHCAMLKREAPGTKTVFIGPCISKKAEAEQYPGDVDCVLTFEELSAWLELEGVTLEPDTKEPRDGKARLFPTSGGILRSMEKDCPDCSYIAVDGIDNCVSALKDILAGGVDRCFVEMSACRGSCVGGPAMDKEHGFILKDTITVGGYAGEKDFDLPIPDERTLAKDIPFMPAHHLKPGASAIEEVLAKTGKTLPEHELNCGSCGYDTCRDKAAAVLQGKAELTMCLPYLMDKAESFSDNIIKNTPNGILVLNESLEVQQINAAACHMTGVKSAGDVLGEQVVRILDPHVFFEVMRTGHNVYEKWTYLAEYQRYVTQTVIYDRSYNIIILIMRDVTEEENNRAGKAEISRKTIEITDKVIEKQMRTVQEIASLLGETAAETKIALTKLKETLQGE